MLFPCVKKTTFPCVKRCFLWLHQVSRMVFKCRCFGTPPSTVYRNSNTERGATSFTRNFAESGNRRQLQLFWGGLIFILTRLDMSIVKFRFLLFDREGVEANLPPQKNIPVNNVWILWISESRPGFIYYFLYSTLPQCIDRFIDRQFLIRISLYDTLIDILCLFSYS